MKESLVVKQDLCVSLLFAQYRYIPICNTKQYMYKTKYDLLHNSRTYTNVYIGNGSTCMYKGNLKLEIWELPTAANLPNLPSKADNICYRRIL